VMECDVALVDLRVVLTRDGYKVYGGSSSSDHVLLGEKGVEHVTYRCLPDTVDPRGLKPRLAMIVVPDYRGFRIEVNAVATDGRSNAESSPAAPVLPG